MARLVSIAAEDTLKWRWRRPALSKDGVFHWAAPGPHPTTDTHPNYHHKTFLHLFLFSYLCFFFFLFYFIAVVVVFFIPQKAFHKFRHNLTYGNSLSLSLSLFSFYLKILRLFLRFSAGNSIENALLCFEFNQNSNTCMKSLVVMHHRFNVMNESPIPLR